MRIGVAVVGVLLILGGGGAWWKARMEDERMRAEGARLIAAMHAEQSAQQEAASPPVQEPSVQHAAAPAEATAPSPPPVPRLDPRLVGKWMSRPVDGLDSGNGYVLHGDGTGFWDIFAGAVTSERREPIRWEVNNGRILITYYRKNDTGGPSVVPQFEWKDYQVRPDGGAMMIGALEYFRAL